MIFRSPLPFLEALQTDAVRAILPTDFTTELMRKVAPDLRRRGVWSATAANADYVGSLQATISDLLSGKLGRAQAKLKLQQAAQLATGRAIGTDGTLTDLTSERRINLQVDTQVDMMLGAGQRLQGDQPDVRDQWPCLELIRVGGAKHPRDWQDRFVAAGGTLYGPGRDRMIARKDDPVWENLGSSTLFPDGLDNDFAPFAFGSHMETVQVRRSECVSLGVIAADAQIAPAKPIDFNAQLQATPQLNTPALQQAVIEDLAGKGITAEIVDGVLRYIGGLAA